MTVENRLQTLALDIPTASPPVANYMPYVITGNLISISGQIPITKDGVAYVGQVGSEVSLDDAKAAARLCGVNLIAQMKSALGGDLERVSRIVKLSGFVNCGADFKDHALVMNGASDLMVEVFGDKGRHARAATGASSLPLGSTVEIDALVEFN